MKTINLRWIYPHYRHDEFVEVSDEVWEVMRQAQREMNNYERRKVYQRAYYSLDAYSWTENYALEHGRSLGSPKTGHSWGLFSKKSLKIFLTAIMESRTEYFEQPQIVPISA